MGSHPEGLTLIGVLVGHIQQYDGERLSYWVHDSRLTKEEARRNRVFIDLMDDLASAILKAELAQFSPSDELFDFTPQQVARFEGQARDLILEKLQIEIAEDFCWRVDEAADRALEIGGLVLTDPPSSRVIGYLNRLARCYISGFFPECVILCRSVLDSALSEMFREKHSIPPQNLMGKIEFAKTSGWLSQEHYTNANTIRLRGNKAVHEDPYMVKQVLETIRLVMEVLSSLEK